MYVRRLCIPFSSPSSTFQSYRDQPLSHTHTRLFYVFSPSYNLLCVLSQVLCTACHPYSLHLYERLVTGLTMTAEFCAEFYEECSGADQLGLEEGYCDYHAELNEDGTNAYWSYPLVIERESWKKTECGRVLQYRTAIDPTLDLTKPHQPLWHACVWEFSHPVQNCFGPGGMFLLPVYPQDSTEIVPSVVFVARRRRIFSGSSRPSIYAERFTSAR